MAIYSCTVLLGLVAQPALPATYTVSNTNDSGAGSLRQAILDANSNPGADTIWFIIGTGAQTITPATALPEITGPVLLDGWVQTGFTNTPLIRLDGVNLAGLGNFGLNITAGPSTVRGLIITRFATGIRVANNAAGFTLRGSYIGTTGAAAGLGNTIGLNIASGSNITLGGLLANDVNVISGNTGAGIHIDTGATTVLLQQNRIGTSADGFAALANATGITSFSSSITIGGNTAAARNLVSGNSNVGIQIMASSTGAIIQGNYIGTNLDGTAAIGNFGGGVSDAGTNTLIGGTNVADRNVISANTLRLTGSGTQVMNNFIGTNASGTATVGIVSNGVEIGGSNIALGTTVAGNVISGVASGVVFTGQAGNGNTVRNNLIGTNPTGTAIIANGNFGIRALGGAGAVIGSPGHGNVISGNSQGAIKLEAGAGGYTIQANKIGLNLAGTAVLSNGAGIELRSANNQVGGTTAGTGNQIVGSSGGEGGGYGILLAGGSSTNNRIEGNTIGTNLALDAGMGNNLSTVMFRGGFGNYIGGTAAGAGNIIINSVQRYGVQVEYGTGNRILGNRIYNNFRQGIELDPAGPWPNDALDPDLGPNAGQNFPVVTQATAGGGNITISGRLDSRANSAYRVEYFHSPQCHASGMGQGDVYLGFQDVVTNGSGFAALSKVVANASVAGFVTATATGPDGSTSEFSPCISLGAASPGEFNFGKADNFYVTAEDLQSVDIVVTRSKGVSGAVSVQFSTADSSAVSPVDYAATSVTLNFADGEATKRITVPVVFDALDEDLETFSVKLTNPTGGTTLGAKSNLSVLLYDHEPTLSYVVAQDAMYEEPASGFENVPVAIKLLSPRAAQVSVDWETQAATATPGQDYEYNAGTVTFQPGEILKFINLTLFADAVAEEEEVFYVVWSTSESSLYRHDMVGEVVIKPRVVSEVIFEDGFEEP